MRTVLMIAVLVGAVTANGSETVQFVPPTTPDRPPSIDHPAIPLVDRDGVNVLTSGRPVSTMQTCAGCHDTEFIAGHSYHATAGLDEWQHPGAGNGWRPWDTSPGEFGRWNPFVYRHLTPAGADRLDMGTADWVRLFGPRHTGGGPAVTGRGGTPLDDLDQGQLDGETAVLDPSTGNATRWDWRVSGTAEFNCFVCHLADPDNDARVQALRSGRFDWAATATLARTDLVSTSDDGWQWNEAVFESDQTASAQKLSIVPPSSKACGTCHGLVHMSNAPVTPSYGSLTEWRTEITGQIFSAQNLFDSGMNLASKTKQGRPWDIHAERLLKCAHCHFAINDPAYATEESVSRPRHLAFDSRRLEIGEFLRRPNHNLAKGYSAQGTVANSLDGTMRRCGDCHDALVTHDWLPYKRRHMDRLLCESCHVPAVSAPARRATDWTILTAERKPRIEYVGVRGPIDDPASLIDGYNPALVSRADRRGERVQLGPHNLVTTWFWTFGADGDRRPIRLMDLEQALFDGDRYNSDVLAACDLDGNGSLDHTELVLDTADKVNAVRDRLITVGLANPRITAEIQPFGIHHGVVTKKWARRQCTSCHSAASDISQYFVLAAAVPAGAIPAPVGDTNVRLTGTIEVENGKLVYTPATMTDGFYVLGHDRWAAIDISGIVLILGTLAGTLSHGGFRWYLARRRRGS
ncbi:MAG: hypothetical protein JSW50_11290 [Candidatus Latescibacterota bacterium]|nr:MAG: hypothetical protein JSW50_11290 [Candidatus Latescibacterota bacterium]